MAKGAGGKSANKFAKTVVKEHPVQKTLNATDFFLGICTWALTLRLGCKKVQLPAALRVVETIERPWP